MAIRISDRDLKKINLTNKDNKDKVIKKSNPKKRLENAIDLLKKDEKNEDKIYFNKDFSICVLELKNVTLLSFNDLLRNDNRHIYGFKKTWEKRIKDLVFMKDLSQWNETKKNPIIIEFLYKTDKFVDPDSICAAFKYPLDGLVRAELLIDDDNTHIPLIIPRQEKRVEKKDDLIIVLSSLSDINKYYTETFKTLIK